MGGAFVNPFPSFMPRDLLVGVGCGIGFRMVVYYKAKNAKKFRQGVEYGSARWGTAKDIEPYVDPVFENNVLLTATERLMMSGRPKLPKYARNKNILVIGGSGSGKTRFFVKPNLMQMHSSYVVTDPKGTVLVECGRMLSKNDYRIKVLNTINFAKSMHYNPFAYIRSEKDILKLVNTIIVNTKGEGQQASEDFWVKAEKLYYTALIAYIWYEAPEEEQNFPMVMEMLRAGEVREDDDQYQSPLDELFERLEMKNPEHIAVKYYKDYHSGSAKTLKSIQITLAARLEKFNLSSLAALTATDDLDLPSLGERKVALFALIPDNDTSYNFLVSILYTQLFQQLFYLADHKYGGRLPVHVHFLMDEFANVALPEDFCSLLSTMRSRGISSTIIIQNLAQIKALFKDTWETITGNCDTLVYLGGNEKSTHQYISEMLGKSTIDKRSNGETRGIHGSSSRNYDVLGRELMTPDEVRNMSNKKCLIFIRGFDPIFDDKYIPMKHKRFKETEDGGAKPYVHIPVASTQSILTIMSDNQIQELINNKKQNEKIQIMDLSIEEIMMLGDTSQIYFGEGTNVTGTENANKSNLENDSNSDDEHQVITRQEILENLSDEELKEEMTSRLVDMEFEPNQIEELYQALDAHIKLSVILSYLYPTTTVEEMRSRRENYLKSKGD